MEARGRRWRSRATASGPRLPLGKETLPELGVRDPFRGLRHNTPAARANAPSHTHGGKGSKMLTISHGQVRLCGPHTVLTPHLARGGPRSNTVTSATGFPDQFRPSP